MKAHAAFAVVVCLATESMPARGASDVDVNCEAGPGGDGSALWPFSTVTAAVARARTLGGQPTIKISAGICDAETFPIVVDRPMRLRGQGAASIVTVPSGVTPDDAVPYCSVFGACSALTSVLMRPASVQSLNSRIPRRSQMGTTVEQGSAVTVQQLGWWLRV